MSAPTSYLGTNTSQYFAVLTLSIISVAVGFVAVIGTLYVWTTKFIQHTRPILTLQTYFGCILLSISCIIFAGENTDLNCSVRVFLFNISFSVALCPYIVKGVALYAKLVMSFHTKSLHGTSTFLQTVPMIPFLLLEVIFITISLYVGRDSRGTTPYVDGDNTYCGYHHNETLFGLELGYKCLQILISWWLCYSLRNILRKFAVIYFVDVTFRAFVGAIVLVIWRLGGDVPSAIVCASVGVCLCTVVTSGLNSMPVILILKKGDQGVMIDVVEDLFNAKKHEEEVS